jgi:monoterpene epsilon-lactone hydrolase
LRDFLSARRGLHSWLGNGGGLYGDVAGEHGADADFRGRLPHAARSSFSAWARRFKPAKVAAAGGSAGGGLCGSFVLKARDIGLPMPAAVVLATPEADLTESGDSFETNIHVEVVLTQRLTESIALYADGHDLTDPYLSPLFGDFTKGFPPTILTTGTRDAFLSNTVLMHRKLRRAGIDAELHVWEAMPHGGFFGAPEDREVTEEQARFIRERLAGWSTPSGNAA